MGIQGGNVGRPQFGSGARRNISKSTRRRGHSAVLVAGLPRPQHFRDCPRLRDTTARRERRVAIEDLAQAAQPVSLQLVRQRLEEGPRARRIVIDAQVREHERSHQPTPDGALMVGGVTLALRAISSYGAGLLPSAWANSPVVTSALYHRALTSTGLPMRGVTTQSPTLASIQVSCTPGSPAASSPSVGST